MAEKDISIKESTESEIVGSCDALVTDSDAIEHAKKSIPNDRLIYRATEIFSALADSTRFKILASLIDDELCVCDLVEACGVSQSAISHQLRLLRDRELVTFRRDGQRAVYRLADDHVKMLIAQGLEHAEHIEMGESR